MLSRWTVLLLFPLLLLLILSQGLASVEKVIDLNLVKPTPAVLQLEKDGSGEYFWRFPEGASSLVLPITAGIVVETNDETMMKWLHEHGPWSLSQLPTLGAVYGDRMVTVIVPWPHYAEFRVEDSLSIRFFFPKGREGATPPEIVVQSSSPDPLDVARTFRTWRREAKDTGGIPRPRTLREKLEDLPSVARLFGAPHIYLWGPALFSRHDVERGKWGEFAQGLQNAGAESFAGRLVARFTSSQRKALKELADSEFPARYLTAEIAGAVDTALSDPSLSVSPVAIAAAEAIAKNRDSLASAFSSLLDDPMNWGDGMSIPLLEALNDAGIRKALLVLSNLYLRTPRPDVADRAGELGFLLGPYDSYHSVHSPEADPDSTWETAQFDQAAYAEGRVLNGDGTGHAGFRGAGYHFSPEAAWPYVQERVNGLSGRTAYSTWFVDCDATAECFDDFSPEHEATRVDDINARRKRLAWLERKKGMIVGSEDGSVLFSDVVHYGHGVHTPYLGHLTPLFRDRKGPYFLGGYWPPDEPALSFKPVPVAPSVKTPFFDPRVRIPLYQAALGDEVVATHHWSFDSLKFNDIAETRELMEILYMVPPMYHLNRATWPERKERILKHLAFWAPLHELLATASLERFEWLSDDRLVQRTTFRTARGEVKITVNFDGRSRQGIRPFSASVSGDVKFERSEYLAGGS